MIVSPIAARMASENGIDLKSVKGSGPNGRIIKRDIEAAMETGAKPAAAHSFTASQTVARPAIATRIHRNAPRDRFPAGGIYRPGTNFYLRSRSRWTTR